MGDLTCQKLRKKLKAGIGVNGRPIKTNSSYKTLTSNFCDGDGGDKIQCHDLFNALELVLNPNDRNPSDNRIGFTATLQEVCKGLQMTNTQNWVDTFGELIVEALEATSSAWQEQNRAQQSDEKQNGKPLSSFFKLASGTEKLFVPFSINGDDETLAELFSRLIFSEEETSKLKEWISSSEQKEKLIDYLRRSKGVQQSEFFNVAIWLCSNLLLV